MDKPKTAMEVNAELQSREEELENLYNSIALCSARIAILEKKIEWEKYLLFSISEKILKKRLTKLYYEKEKLMTERYQLIIKKDKLEGIGF